MGSIEALAIVGFMLASYSIVANDVIQTLGTFMSSNKKVPWWVLWLFACSILAAIMIWGWFGLSGDIAYDRLDRIAYPPFIDDGGARPDWWRAWDPPGGIEWFHIAPPLVLLVLTRYGVPVSTTFLVLTIFTLTGSADGADVLPSMLLKSLIGYLVAFGAAIVLFFAVGRLFERWVFKTADAPDSMIWTALQWLSTGFLWSQWLIQDLANIFVFLPRETIVGEAGVATIFDPQLIVFATVVMLGLHAIIFATRGGEIQKIVLTKTNTRDIRSATVIDFLYASVLFVFAEINDLPMSTTWVFLGLLAGRELAITASLREARGVLPATFDVVSDVMRALIGLFVSIFLALAIPRLAGAATVFDVSWVQMSALVAAAFVCFAVIWALRRQAGPANQEA